MSIINFRSRIEQSITCMCRHNVDRQLPIPTYANINFQLSNRRQAVANCNNATITDRSSKSVARIGGDSDDLFIITDMPLLLSIRQSSPFARQFLPINSQTCHVHDKTFQLLYSPLLKEFNPSFNRHPLVEQDSSS